MVRCEWCIGSELEMMYHDTEWGHYVGDDQVFFEYLILESFQAGLSWKTVLFKREHMRDAFFDFDMNKIAHSTEDDIHRWLSNSNLIRSERKLRAMINNAKLFMDIIETYESFENYLKMFIVDFPVDHTVMSKQDIPSSDDVSESLALDLKKRGFKYVGPVIMYAFLQATGIYNDHVVDCQFRSKQ